MLVACAAFFSGAPAFFTAGHQSPSAPKSKTKSTLPKLTEAERTLVANSRAAIMRTGISGPYFDRHFTLVKVVNQSGDRRVVWKFSINEYATMVSDALGFYTKDGKRFDTHGVVTALQSTTEIKRTISRRSANQIMQRCIGNFANPSIEYRATGAEGARLVITAEAVVKTAKVSKKEREREEREREEREARERAARAQGRNTEALEEEGDEGAPIIIGIVDLESGKCRKDELRAAP